MYLKILQNLSLFATIFFRKSMPVNPIMNDPVDRARIEIPKTTFAETMYLDLTDPLTSFGSTAQNMMSKPRKVRKENVSSD